MLNNQTIKKLDDMNLRKMAEVYREQLQNPAVNSVSFDDRFGMITDRQWEDRMEKRIRNHIKDAHFRFPSACIEDIDYAPDRKLDKELILRLAEGRYIRERNNVVVMGAAGAGKTWMGCALGVAACRQYWKTRYIRLPELLEDAHIAHYEGGDRFKKLVKEFSNIRLLIIDEWLHRQITLEQSNDIFEIIEARHQTASTVFITQFEKGGWYGKFGESVVTDAILDRIVHNSYDVVIQGDISMRERYGLR